MHTVWLFVEVCRAVVVEVIGMFWVSADVVEMSALLVGGARHATPDDSRCAGHSRRRRRRISRRLVLVLLGTQRRAVRISSLELPRLLVTEDHPQRQQRRRHDHRAASRPAHLYNWFTLACRCRSTILFAALLMSHGFDAWFTGNHGYHRQKFMVVPR